MILNGSNAIMVLLTGNLSGSQAEPNFADGRHAPISANCFTTV